MIKILSSKEYKELLDEIDTLENDCTYKDRKLTQKNRENIELQTKLDELEEKQKQEAEKRNEQNLLQKEAIRKAKAQHFEDSKAINVLTNSERKLARENRQLRSQNESITVKNNDLEDKLKTANSMINDLEKSNKNLEEQLIHFQNTASNLQVINHELRERLHRLCPHILEEYQNNGLTKSQKNKLRKERRI